MENTSFSLPPEIQQEAGALLLVLLDLGCRFTQAEVSDSFGDWYFDAWSANRSFRIVKDRGLYAFYDLSGDGDSEVEKRAFGSFGDFAPLVIEWVQKQILA